MHLIEVKEARNTEPKYGTPAERHGKRDSRPGQTETHTHTHKHTHTQTNTQQVDCKPA